MFFEPRSTIYIRRITDTPVYCIMFTFEMKIYNITYVCGALLMFAYINHEQPLKIDTSSIELLCSFCLPRPLFRAFWVRILQELYSICLRIKFGRPNILPRLTWLLTVRFYKCVFLALTPDITIEHNFLFSVSLADDRCVPVPQNNDRNTHVCVHTAHALLV